MSFLPLTGQSARTGMLSPSASKWTDWPVERPIDRSNVLTRRQLLDSTTVTGVSGEIIGRSISEGPYYVGSRSIRRSNRADYAVREMLPRSTRRGPLNLGFQPRLIERVAHRLVRRALCQCTDLGGRQYAAIGLHHASLQKPPRE